MLARNFGLACFRNAASTTATLLSARDGTVGSRGTTWTKKDRKEFSTIPRHARKLKSRPCAPTRRNMGSGSLRWKNSSTRCFYRFYYYKRWRDGDPALTMPMLVIGHNLPFDLGAISSSAAPSIGRNYGGLTAQARREEAFYRHQKIGLRQASVCCASGAGTSAAIFNLSIPCNWVARCSALAIPASKRCWIN